jgi:hypothetical protein
MKYFTRIVIVSFFALTLASYAQVEVEEIKSPKNLPLADIIEFIRATSSNESKDYIKVYVANKPRNPACLDFSTLTITGSVKDGYIATLENFVESDPKSDITCEKEVVPNKRSYRLKEDTTYAGDISNIRSYVGELILENEVDLRDGLTKDTFELAQTIVISDRREAYGAISALFASTIAVEEYIEYLDEKAEVQTSVIYYEAFDMPGMFGN